MTERIAADVCVIGAGYAGLTAALRLHQAGKTVVVLEARDRVGGRIWTEPLPDGTPIDRGGAWLGPRPRRGVRAGARVRRRPPTRPTWPARTCSSTATASAGTPASSRRSARLAVATIALAQYRIDRMAKQVPLEAPWTAARAEEWDQRSVASWLAALGHPPRRRSRPVRDGGPRADDRRPRRRLAARTCCSSSARTAASARCSRSRTARRRTWSTVASARWRRRIADDPRRRGPPRRAGAFDHPARRPRGGRHRRGRGARPPTR